MNIGCAILLSFLFAATSSLTVVENRFAIYFSSFVSHEFPDSKILLNYCNFFQPSSILSSKWAQRLEKMISRSYVISASGGLTNIHLNPSSSTIPIVRPPKVLKYETAHLIILVLPRGILTREVEQKLHARLNLPLLHPPTVRNLDKYLIVTEKKALKSLYQSEVIQNLKFKVFLALGEDGGVDFHQFCPHCPTKEKILLESNYMFAGREYFPDFQKNYFGFVLRASSTDKMGGDLEFGVDYAGKQYAKRGVFASTLNHLASGLNFTAELFSSSAGSSTGHTLANGSWVGSVGDVFNGDASFCMLCGMSYSRHSIVEICSPVTYEYIRFAIGPPDKLYTWEAIFWPFDGYVWIALLATTFVTALVSGLFLRWDSQYSSWNVFSVVQYLGRIFIEQSQSLPKDLPHTVKIVLSVWLLFALVGATVYRAKEVTLMTFPLFEHVPDTYEELVESPYEIQFHYFPNIAYNSFKSSTNPVIMTTFQQMVKEPDPIKCLQRTLTSKSVCIMFTSVYDDLLSRNMSDRFGQSPIGSSSNYAFMFTPGISSHKRAVFTTNFRHILQTSLAMGLNEWWSRSDAYLLLKLKNTWVSNLPTAGNRMGVFQYEHSKTSDDVLHLKNLKGAFTVVVGGLLLAVAVFTLELARQTFERFRKLQRGTIKDANKLEKPLRVINVNTNSFTKDDVLVWSWGKFSDKAHTSVALKKHGV